MVKFSNKGKGKPSKRRNLKTKYKIQRKVKQYRKKVKKQANKMKQSGIRHKKNPQKDVLPNMFPFKQQMLLQYKQTLPKQAQVPIQVLNSAEFGLVTLQNKQVYFSKSKENLTKKYITNLENIAKKAKIVLQVLDSRCPQLCIDENFRAYCKKNNIQRIPILSKIDTVFQKKCVEAEQKLRAKKQKPLRFTQDSKHKKQLIDQIIRSIKQVKSQMGLQENQNVSVFVSGKANTGKHTLITMLCKYAGKYQDIPSELFELVLIPGVKLIDAPYRLQDKTNFPLFYTPSELNQAQSLSAQQQNHLKLLFFGGIPFFKTSVLNRNGILQHYMIQDYTSIEDLCKKIGKSLRIFGKGGMIDVAKVRQKILFEWFTGKLNKFINPLKEE